MKKRKSKSKRGHDLVASCYDYVDWAICLISYILYHQVRFDKIFSWVFVKGNDIVV